jgi:hypothetical protein
MKGEWGRTLVLQELLRPSSAFSHCCTRRLSLIPSQNRRQPHRGRSRRPRRRRKGEELGRPCLAWLEDAEDGEEPFSAAVEEKVQVKAGEKVGRRVVGSFCSPLIACERVLQL